MEELKTKRQLGMSKPSPKSKSYYETALKSVQSDFVDRLVNNYGYSKEQMALEYNHNGARRMGEFAADIAIWKNPETKAMGQSPLIVVECKLMNNPFKEFMYARGYQSSVKFGAQFFVITNSTVTECFYVNRGPDNLEMLEDIPTAVELLTMSIEDIVSLKKKYSKDDFAKVLFVCHNIIRNNDKLSPETAFDEISKILFLKIRYENQNANKQLFSLNVFEKLENGYKSYNNESAKPFYQHLFDITKDTFAKYSLFDKNDEIKIREISFKQIVKELETINLSVNKDDVKGFAFEKLLGRTFRGELGQFFTPRNIVDFMVEVLDPQEGELICDPCCGSGGFLINAFDYIREKQGEQFTNTENFIYGTDANPRMARTAKMNMIIRGGDPSGIYHHDGLLNVDGIWDNRFDVILTNPPFGARVSNELVVAESDRFTDEEKIKTYTGKYGQEYIDAQKQVNDHIGMPILSLFKTGRDMNCGLTDVLFIERCLNLLKPGGRLGIVLPESVLNNQNLQPVRDYFESIAKIILIVSLPQDVFSASGASIKTSLVFFKKFTDAERRQYDDIKEKAIHTIRTKYDSNLSKAVENVEIRNIIKHEFKYPIVMSKIKSLSFDGTNDDLSALKEEFIKYRNSNNLW